MYLEQSRIAKALIPDRDERTAYLASIDVWVSAGSLLIQLFIVGRVMSRLGTWPALVALPVVSGASLLTVGVMEQRRVEAGVMLGTVVGAQAALRIARYALGKPAKETLFTVIPRDANSRAVAFVSPISPAFADE